jgi:hypothetical protein
MREMNSNYEVHTVSRLNANGLHVHTLHMVKKKLKLYHHTPWRRLGGEEV